MCCMHVNEEKRDVGNHPLFIVVVVNSTYIVLVVGAVYAEILLLSVRVAWLPGGYTETLLCGFQT